MAFRYCFRILFVSFLFLRCLVVCQEQEVIASPSFPLLYADPVEKVTESPDSSSETNPTQSPQGSLSQSSPLNEGGSTNISTSIQPVTSHDNSVSSSFAQDGGKAPELSVSAIPVETSSPQVTQSESSPAQSSSSSPVTSIDLTTTSKSPLQKIPVTRTTTKPKIRLPPLTSTTPTPTFPPPLAKDPIGVRFYLYTRFHSNSPYVLDANSADSLKGAYFTFSYANGKKASAKNRLYIVIHGLSDGVEVTPWMKTVKTRILETDRDANVVLIDWSRGAAVNLLNDLRFASVRIVGQQAVQLIKGLQYLYPDTFSGDNVHIIAHSFGTFAADVVGRNIEGLGRITGLDPAGGVSNIALIPAPVLVSRYVFRR